MGTKNHTDHQTILGVTNNKIMTAQFECYQKIMQATEEYEGKQCISIYFDLKLFSLTKAFHLLIHANIILKCFLPNTVLIASPLETI